MGIVDEDIAKVRDVTDIVAIISNYTQLRRVGRRFSGLCPFHGEKSPSFSVNSEQGLYYCFGCGAKGDAITFVREQEQLDFVGAVEFLANKAGVELHYTDTSENADRARRSKLQDAIGEAVAYYHERLLVGADAAAARAYLRQRGFDGETVRRYKLGWAPDGWDALSRHLRLSNDDLTDSGLGFVNSRNRQQDAFRARVLFPIFDPQDKALGFGGRILPGGQGPKYKNSSDSKVYSKSRILYGLNWAKTDIVKADEVIVCEGYTDVIGFARAGIPRAVATCGTALTEDHVRLLRRFARRVLLAFDADAAGQNAAARFYEWERKHDLDVAVVHLKEGKDPGEIALSQPELLAAAVSEAKSFLGFRVERVLAAGDLGTAESRARVATSAVDIVNEHPDPLVRDQYLVDIAGRCRIDVDLLRNQATHPQQRPVEQRPRVRTSPSHRETVEHEALRALIHGDTNIAEQVPIELFGDPLCSACFEAIDSAPDLVTAIDQASTEVRDVLTRLSVEDPPSDTTSVVALMWKGFLERQLRELTLQRTSQRDAADMDAFAKMVAAESWYRRQLAEFEDVDNRKRTGAAVQSLLVWLHHTEDTNDS